MNFWQRRKRRKQLHALVHHARGLRHMREDVLPAADLASLDAALQAAKKACTGADASAMSEAGKVLGERIDALTPPCSLPEWRENFSPRLHDHVPLPLRGEQGRAPALHAGLWRSADRPSRPPHARSGGALRPPGLSSLRPHRSRPARGVARTAARRDTALRASASATPRTDLRALIGQLGPVAFEALGRQSVSVSGPLSAASRPPADLLQLRAEVGATTQSDRAGDRTSEPSHLQGERCNSDNVGGPKWTRTNEDEPPPL